MRDYGHAEQIGLEQTPQAYVETMRQVFAEVWRVLKDDGTVWLNLGDSYAGGGNYRGINSENTLTSKQNSNRGARGLSQQLGALGKDTGLEPKNLIGIPWRVAFALQQPYENHLVKIATDRSWLAAMIDGEGCITIPEAKSPHGSGSSFPPIVQIRMCDTEALEKCVYLTGKGGNLTEQLPPSYESSNQRAAYQWRINGQTAASVLADVYPFFLIKRKQACVAWTLQKIRDSYETKRGVPIPDVALGKQQECRRLIGLLNQRKPVDLPSWIEEPSIIVTPGWYLRSDVIWHKPNPMPESVTDRPTRSHEYIFLLTKQPRYYYDAEAIKEPCSESFENDSRWETGPTDRNEKNGYAHAGAQNPKSVHRLFNKKVNLDRGDLGASNVGGNGRLMRNKRTVWTVTPANYRDAHFATFPPDLIKPCILAGTKPGDTVLDPFFGAGTTGLVALELARRCIGIELNPAYAQLAHTRCLSSTPGLPL